MATAHFIHGFNVRDGGKGTVLTLEPFFRRYGFDIRRCGFGWRFLLRVRLGNRRRARQIAADIRHGDIIVAHSDGANIAHLALEYLSKVRPYHKITCIYFNPALDRDMPLPVAAEKCLVFAAPDDGPLRLARWLPFHRWGDMGRHGPTAPDRRYLVMYYPDIGIPGAGHSGAFKTELNLAHVRRAITHTLRSQLYANHA